MQDDGGGLPIEEGPYTLNHIDIGNLAGAVKAYELADHTDVIG